MTYSRSGKVLDFLTNSRQKIKSLKVYFSPKQAGEGTPSPENVREISGYDGVEVHHHGKNLCPAANGIEMKSWVYSSASRNYYFNGLEPNTPYTLSATITETTGSDSTKRLYLRGKTYTFINTGIEGRRSITVNSSDTGTLIIAHNNIGINDVAEYITEVQLEKGSVMTAYEPYEAHVESELPSEYQRVEYLESTGTQWIDTGIIPTTETVSQIKLKVLQSNGYNIYGYYIGQNVSYRFFLTNSRFYFDFPDKSRAQSISGTGVINEIYELELGNRYIKNLLNDNYYVKLSPSSFECSNSLKLNNSGVSTAFAKVYWYYVKIYEEDIPVRNLIPCYRRSDSKPGMYDTVSGTFYTNSGTGEFILGPAVGRTKIEWPSLGTLYGGYVDLISGEVVETYDCLDLGEYNWGTLSGNRARITDFARKYNAKTPNYSSPPNAIAEIYEAKSASTTLQDYQFAITTALIMFYDGENAPSGKLVYELNEPVTYQLTPSQLETFIGTNTFWSNADRIEIEYNLVETPEIRLIKQTHMLAAPHMETVSGATANFNTDMVAPLKECKVYFTPVQEGEGTPSLENVRPISGWDGVTVTRTGKNLLDESLFTHVGYISSNGTFQSDSRFRYTSLIALNPGTYYFNATNTNVSSGYGGIHVYDKEGNWISRLVAQVKSIGQNYSFSFTLTDEMKYIRVSAPILSNAQIEKGSTATEYEPYQGQSLTIQFPQTIYGGYVDLIKGEVVKTWDKYTFTGNENIGWHGWGNDFYYHAYQTTSTNFSFIRSQETLCNMAKPTYGRMINIPSGQLSVIGSDTIPSHRYIVVSDTGFGENLEECKSKLQELYENGTPLTVVNPMCQLSYNTYSLTPQTINTIRGSNIINSNANGNIEVSYWTH